MRLQSTVIGAVLAVGLAALPALAGGRGQAMDPEARQQQRLEKMQKELSLSEDQVQKLQAIFEEGRKQAQADFEAAGKDRDSLRLLSKERRKATHEKIEALLTDEQKARHAQLVEQRKGRVRERLQSYEKPARK